MGNYCQGCQYCGKKAIDAVRKNKDELIVVLCPGDEEVKKGYPLASGNPASATQRIISCLPKGKTINDYAVAELVRCNPGRDKKNKYKQPSKTSIQHCSKYLEELLIEKNYKKIIALNKNASDIVSKVLSNNPQLNQNLVKGKHPQSGVTNEELKSYFL